MKIQSNEIISVKVKSIEQYGVLVEAEGYEGIVLIPNLSWNIYGVQKEMSNLFSIGDTLDAMVLDSSTVPFNASFKDAHPELNPWKKVNKFLVNTIHKAKVVTKTDFGYFLELEKGLRALLHNVKSLPELSDGEIVSVKINSIDQEKKKIVVSYVLSENKEQ
ncbi:S1 RNA-binding domain-containing protein [Pseudoalteromonas sp. A601]|uniref:S1 RNA-binding domain-containing protein n=1 Tax=Pseudoalteromonas sp. A601 TaxID=1967839 RepID=UPI00111E8141|nr:S1 RNA-binding domain-containing protein [Pseudoalteromonas sp. A601]